MEQATISRADIPAKGEPCQGGFYIGCYMQDGQQRALIVSGMEGDIPAAYGTYGKDISAISFTDSLANTKAMADAGSEAAAKVLAMRMGGFDDWAIAARDPLEMLYRECKPTTDANYCFPHDGDNPSTGKYQYTKVNPLQTSIPGFRHGEENCFRAAVYISSTQYSPYNAWYQVFVVGYQIITLKGNEYRARAVRSALVID